MRYESRFMMLIVFLAVLAVQTPLPAHPGFCKLTIIGTPVLTVDPTCPNCDGGVLDIYLRNDNSGSVPLLLTVGSLTDKTSKKPASGNLNLQPLNPCTRAAFTSDHLTHGQILLLRVTASNILQEGEWQSELYNRGVDLGSFTVTRNHLPFNVTLVTAKADTPEITFNRNQPTSLTLSNADQVSYPITLSMIVKGHTSESKDVTVPPGNSVTVSLLPSDSWFDQPWFGHFKDETVDGQLVLTLRAPPCPSNQCPAKPSSANMAQEAACFAGTDTKSGTKSDPPDSTPEKSASDASFASPSGSQVKSAATGSTVGAAMAATSADVPTKIIKVSVHLSYDSRLRQFFWILAVLLAGALSSLFLSSYVPNQLQRIKLKKQLDQLATGARDLPMPLASRLRVSVGLEEKRLGALLDSAWGFAPGFSSVVDEVNTRISALEKRLQLVQQLGDLRSRFELQRLKMLFPTPMNKLSDIFEHCVELLRKIDFKDDDKAAAQKVLQDLSAKLDNLENLELFCKQEPDQVQMICDRLGTLDVKIPDENPVSPRARELYLNMRRRVVDIKKKAEEKTPSPGTATGAPAPTAPAGAKLVCGFPMELLPDVDRLTVKMGMLLDSSRLLTSQQDYKGREGSSHEEAKRIFDAMEDACDLLAERLESQNSEEFAAAQRLLQQIKEHIFSKDVEQEIAPSAPDANDAREGADSAPENQPSRLPIWKRRDWGKNARWVRLFLLLLLVLLVIAVIAVWQLWTWYGMELPRWMCVVSVVWPWVLLLIVAPSVLFLLSRHVMALVLKRLSAWRDRKRPLYDRDPLTRKEEKTILVADRRNVRIQSEVSATRVYEPTQLRVRFCKEQLNYSAALQDITPIWNFGHDDLTPEEGWDVVHYFPRPREYTVTVKFQRRLGGFLTYADPETDSPDVVYVMDVINAALSELGVTLLAAGLNIVWLLVALVPALLALYTGAIDQLNKLDAIPALIAVFTAGFTSDQVKNVLTQKPK